MPVRAACWPQSAQLVHVARSRQYSRHRARAIARAAEGRARVEAAIGKLVTSTLPKPKKDMLGAVVAIEAMEVRSALRSMKPPERLKAVHDAVALGDENFVHAATTGLPTLSGLSATEQALLTDYWQRHWHSETLARISRLKAASTESDRQVALFGKWSSGVGASTNAAAAAAEKSQQLAAETMTAARSWSQSLSSSSALLGAPWSVAVCLKSITASPPRRTRIEIGLVIDGLLFVGVSSPSVANTGPCRIYSVHGHDWGRRD